MRTIPNLKNIGKYDIRRISHKQDNTMFIMNIYFYIFCKYISLFR